MNFKSHPMAVRAIIFDLDGTLVDTERLHFEAFNSVLRPQGVKLTAADYFTRLLGYDDHDCLMLLLREHYMPANEAVINDLIAQKTVIYQRLAATRAALFPGAREFVLQCAERFPLMLVTGSLRAEAELLLDKSQIRECFTWLIAAEDALRGKPAPDGFLLALRWLNVSSTRQPVISAGECLVIEDTRAGVDAAQQAGMRVLAVAQTVRPAALASAELVRPSLQETDLDEVLELLTATSYARLPAG